MPVRKLLSAAFTGVTFASVLWSAGAEAGLKFNMTPGVTSISRSVYHLHMLSLGLVTVIAIIVFGLMFWTLYHHRKSKGAVPAQFHHSTKWEIIWTVIPIVVLVCFAIPATKVLVRMEQTQNPDLTIKITGYQWKWRYDYLDDDFGFFSVLAPDSEKASQLGSGVDVTKVKDYLLDVDNPVVIPVHKKVRLLTTSNDVIHSWWVPDLGWKRDAIPGFINDNWTVVDKIGTYYGRCAELCGKGHGFMPIVLKAVSDEDYQAWVADMKKKQEAAAAGADRTWTKEELMARGEKVYSTTCVACHQDHGQGLPPAFPALTGSKTVNGPVSEHINTVLNGRPGTAMQAFSQQLNVVDLAAVITFERNALGNNVGDIVQPSDIQAAESQ